MTAENGDRVYWHEGERAARVPESCIRAIVTTAKGADKVQPSSAVAVFTVLALHAGGDGDGARPKVDTIADLLDLSPAQVRRIITTVLIPAGVVSKRPNVQQGRKVGNVYTLTRPEARIPTASQGALPTAPPGARQPLPEARSNEQTVEQTNEQTNPLAADAAGHLFAVPDVPADPEQEAKARAHALTVRVFERKTPKPAQKFVAVLAVAKALFAADWPESDVERAMVETPTISTRACEFTRSRWTSGHDPNAGIDTDRGGPTGLVDWRTS